MVKAKPVFRRITAILLVLLILIPSMNVFEASGASISAETAVGKPGDQVSVNVSISGNPGIAYLKLKIGYDATQLTLKGAQNAGVLSGTFTTSKTTDVNPYVLQWMGAENSSGNGVVATLTFQISSNASAGDKAISVSVAECYNENYDDVTLSASNGKVTVNTTSPKVLSSISVSQQPNKTTYFVGESLDTTGLQLKLTYSDGSTSYVTGGFTTSGFSSASAGTKTVTVAYSGKTTTFTVTVNNLEDPSVQSIWIKRQPDKDIYLIGEAFDSTGLIIGVNYYDGTETDVTTGFSVSGFNSQIEGRQTLTVSFGGKTATFKVRVDADGIFTITFDANGGINAPAPITYRDNDFYKVPYETPTRDGYVFGGWANSPTSTLVHFSAGSLVSSSAAYYGDYTVYAIWKPVEVESVSISSNPLKTTYYIGDSLNTSGLKLLVSYSDGSTEIISSGFTTSGFSSASAGTKTVTVTYSGKTTTFTVTVQPKPSAATISANNVSANPGDQVSVNVTISGNPGIAYLKLKIGYDATQLTLKGAQNAGALSGTFTTSKTTDVNPYVLQWMGAENSSGNGVAATLNFQIASNASAGDKAISVSVAECYNENYDDVTLSASNGKVTVNTSFNKTGDINNDGVVDILDATMIQKFAVDKINLTDKQKELADVNDDGVVDILDATMIQKFTVDKITEFPKKA